MFIIDAFGGKSGYPTEDYMYKAELVCVQRDNTFFVCEKAVVVWFAAALLTRRPDGNVSHTL